MKEIIALKTAIESSDYKYRDRDELSEVQITSDFGNKNPFSMPKDLFSDGGAKL